MIEASSSSVASLVSAHRFAPFLAAAGDDEERATALYEWNAQLAAASFEVFSYFEVVVRNAMDRELQRHVDEADRGIPWFLLMIDGKRQPKFDEDVDKVRRRLRDQHRDRETRDQIVAGTDFGFWTALLHSEREELWRRCLRHAFPRSTRRRKDVVQPLEALRIFRNRLAHHDSLLAVDVPFRLTQMLQIAEWIDPAAGRWLRQVERVTEVFSARPTVAVDTVVVGAARAWALYEAASAYVCQAGRSIRPVRHLAFYVNREVQRDVPEIRSRLDNVDWSDTEVRRLRASSDADDVRLSEIIAASRALGWIEGRYQVFDLSSAGVPGHVTLARTVPNLRRGAGSAYARPHRYTSLTALRTARSTDDLG